MNYAVMSHVLKLQGEELFRTAASLGFDGIEWSVPETDTNELFKANGRKQLAAWAAEHQLLLPSVCLLEFNQYGLKESNPAIRTKDVIRRTIEAAAFMGMSTILLPFFGPSELFTEDEKQRTAEGLKEVAREAEAMDITLALENTLSAVENLKLLAAVGNKAVSVYYDVCNATFWKHDMPGDLRRLREHIAQIHFKDGNKGPWDAMLGQGFVDFSAAAQAIADIGYNGWVVLESYTPNDPIQDTAINLAFSRSILGTFEKGRK
jgi:D-psicose/D-tagatose/L-ribulose 3-epimerase